MDDFSIPGSVDSYGIAASPHNNIGPGRRPVSSMSPTIIVDGNKDVKLVGFFFLVNCHSARAESEHRIQSAECLKRERQIFQGLAIF